MRYAGKVGTGFDGALLAEIGAQDSPSWSRKPAPTEVPRAAARRAHWVKPSLVAEVGFAEFTADNVIRHASFVGLREDKAAKDVVLNCRLPKPITMSPHVPALTDVPHHQSGSRDRRRFGASPKVTSRPITKPSRRSCCRCSATVRSAWCAVRRGAPKHCFFQKHDAGSFGEHVHHVPVREKDGSTEDYLWLDDAAGILNCVQMGTIEFHGWGSRIEDPRDARPDDLRPRPR